jgi:hypothetical protein
MKLCEKCGPLVFRTDLDTLEKLREELCPVCKALLRLHTIGKNQTGGIRAGSIRGGLNKREAKLLRKYGNRV